MKLIDLAAAQYHRDNNPRNHIIADVPEWAQEGAQDIPKVRFKTALSVADMVFLSKHQPHENPESVVKSLPFILDVFMLCACNKDGTLMVQPSQRDRFANEVDAMLCANIITRCKAYERIMQTASSHEEGTLGKPSAS